MRVTEQMNIKEPILISLVAFVLLSLVFGVAGKFYHDQLISNEQKLVESYLEPYTDTIFSIITQKTSLIDSLKAYLLSHNNSTMITGHFQEFAEGLYSSQKGIQTIHIFVPQMANLSYSPEAIQYSTVLTIAEYLAALPAEWRAGVERTLQTSKITLSEPIEFPDGSHILIEQQAFYQGNTLRGLAVVELNFEELLQDIGLFQTESNLEVALINDGGNLIYGDPEILAAPTARFRIELPDGYWELAAIPKEGWEAAIQPAWVSYILFSLALILLMVFMTYEFSNRQIELRDTVKQRTAALEEKILETRNANDQVRRLNRLYSILSDFNQSIIRDPSSEHLYQRACEIAMEKGGYPLAWVGILSATSQKLIPIASAGSGCKSLDDIDISLAYPPQPSCPIDQALRSSQRQVRNAIEQGEQTISSLSFALQHGLSSIASFPLVVGNRMRGVLNLYGSEADHFDDTELKLLDELAIDLSFAMEFVEMSEQRFWAETEAEQLNSLYQVLSLVNQQVLHMTTREELFQRVCQIAVEIGHFKLAWMAWVNAEERTLQVAATAGDHSRGLDQMVIPLNDLEGFLGPLGIAIQTGDVYTSNSFENTIWKDLAGQIGFTAMGTFPIRLEGMICGALNIHVENRDYFRIKEINLLQEVAEAVSFALDHQLQDFHRRQAEAAVRDQNRLLTAIINSTSEIIIFSLDQNYCYLTYNERHRLEMRKRWGVEISPGVNMLDLITDPEQRATTQRRFDRILAGESFTEIQYVPDTGVYYQSNWNPIITDAGEVIGLTGFIQDVTEQKNATEQIKRSELRYRLAQQAAHIGSWEWNIHSDRLTWSDELFQIFEKDPNTFIPSNQAVIDSILEEDKPLALAAVEDSLTQGIPFHAEYRIHVPGERIKWVEARGEVIFDDQNQPYLAVGTVQDITSRKEVEEALRESEARYRDLFLSNPQPMWVADVETLRFLDVNDAAVAKYGYSRDEFLSMTIKEIRPPEDVPAALSRMTDQVYEQLGIFRHRLKDGRIIQVQINTHLLNYAGHKARVVMAIDVTERLAAEAKIRELNATLEKRVAERTAQLEASNKELEAFAYSVSHDLRAPLRAIDGFSRILQQDYAAIFDDEGKRLLRIIRDNTSKIDHLITDLLALSRVSRSQFSDSILDMTAMAKSVYDEITTPDIRQKIVLEVDELPAAAGDPTLMRQVWSNLISNAIKYSLPKVPGRIEIRGYEQDGVCTYSIHDNGVGFNPRYKDKLFGLFQRLHKEGEFEGTGVGLAIVQRIIHRHGGQVWAEGEVDHGAMFYFSIPQRTVQYA